MAWRSVQRSPSWWQKTPVESTQTKVNGQKLETVTSFKQLGSVITDEGSKPKILSRIAQATAALTKVETSFEWQEYFSQFQDMTDVLPCHTYFPVCFWSMDLHSRAAKKKQAMEMRCYRRYYASGTKIILPTSKSVGRSSRQSDYRDANWGGMDTSPVHQVWPK